MKTVSNLPFGLTKRLIYTIVSGAVAWALTKYAANLDPDVSAAITGLVASVFGYSAPADKASTS
jgi:hypothetical protein